MQPNIIIAKLKAASWTTYKQPHTVNAEIFVPMKIKPTKICTQEELATVITVDHCYPWKLNPSKFHPWNIVSMKICTFTTTTSNSCCVSYYAGNIKTETIWTMKFDPYPHHVFQGIVLHCTLQEGRGYW